MPNVQKITRGFGNCLTSGCQNEKRSSVSARCNACHQRQRIHGDARQTLVTRKELKPYEDRVRKIMATGDQALIVSSLTEINKRIQGYAESVSHGITEAPQWTATRSRQPIR